MPRRRHVFTGAQRRRQEVEGKEESKIDQSFHYLLPLLLFPFGDRDDDVEEEEAALSEIMKSSSHSQSGSLSHQANHGVEGSPRPDSSHSVIGIWVSK